MYWVIAKCFWTQRSYNIVVHYNNINNLFGSRYTYKIMIYFWPITHFSNARTVRTYTSSLIMFFSLFMFKDTGQLSAVQSVRVGLKTQLIKFANGTAVTEGEWTYLFSVTLLVQERISIYNRAVIDSNDIDLSIHIFKNIYFDTQL